MVSIYTCLTVLVMWGMTAVFVSELGRCERAKRQKNLSISLRNVGIQEVDRVWPRQCWRNYNVNFFK